MQPSHTMWSLVANGGVEVENRHRVTYVASAAAVFSATMASKLDCSMGGATAANSVDSALPTCVATWVDSLRMRSALRFTTSRFGQLTCSASRYVLNWGSFTDRDANASKARSAVPCVSEYNNTQQYNHTARQSRVRVVYQHASPHTHARTATHSHAQPHTGHAPEPSYGRQRFPRRTVPRCQ